MSKRKNIMSWVVAIIAVLVVIVASYLFEAGVVWVIAHLLGYDISYKFSLGISLLIAFVGLVLKAIFNQKA